MKSSSQLFPVELASAEVLDDRFIDCYSLKPNNSADKTVELALIHVTPKQINRVSKQILFIHDAFHSHWQWLEPEYQHCIDRALELGIGVWLIDWRSHGSSKKNKSSELNTIFEMAKYDLPAALAFINEKSSIPISLVAKGFGAQMALHCLADQTPIDQLALLDAQPVFGGLRYWVPGSKMASKMKVAFKPWLRGNGPEMESKNFWYDQLSRRGWSMLFRRDYRRQVNATIATASSRIAWFCSNRSSLALAKQFGGSEAQLVLDKQGNMALQVERWLETL